MKNINNQIYYTVGEVCKVLGIKRQSLAYLRRQNKLPFRYIKVLSSYCYPKDEIDKYVEQMTKGATFRE